MRSRSLLCGLDAGPRQGDVMDIMSRDLSPQRTILATLPAPFRRVAGFWLLTLTLWLASAIALFR